MVVRKTEGVSIEKKDPVLTKRHLSVLLKFKEETVLLIDGLSSHWVTQRDNRPSVTTEERSRSRRRRRRPFVRITW